MFDLTYRKPRVIAEIGCNHMGDFEIAKDLVRLAKRCGAKVAKFQKRCVRELLSADEYAAPHPNPQHAYGETYGKHREFLEFTIRQHEALQAYCQAQRIQYAASVWDVTSARQIIKLDPPFIKVPSAQNNNPDLLKVLRDRYAGEVHISVGMTTHAEEEALVAYFEATGQARSRLVLYSCTSGYPVADQDVALLELVRLRRTFGARVKDFGFSGHHLGIAIDIAAYTLGGAWIERHFTKDRTWKGTDHAASLEPQGFQKLVRDLESTFHALRYKKQDPLAVEVVQRAKLKYKTRKPGKG